MADLQEFRSMCAVAIGLRERLSDESGLECLTCRLERKALGIGSRR